MPLRLMCITAHPDDECGAFGGALLMAAAQGMTTAVLCLTPGSSGSYRAPGQTDTELAAMRRKEFESACRFLGVQEATLLDYPDGGLARQPFLAIATDLVEHIRRFRPHIMLTFGAEGGVNLHRDHTSISLAVTAAFHWASSPAIVPEQPGNPLWSPQKLYYAATFFFSKTEEASQRGATRTPCSLTLDMRAWREKKLEAFRHHVSQVALLDQVLERIPESFDHEGYLLAAARQPNLDETTLWEGVELEDVSG